MSATSPVSVLSIASRDLETEKRRVRKDLRCSIGDGAAFGVMVGLGETYLPAFALAAGLGELIAGMIASLPLLIGGLLQLISPVMIRKLGSHKRWVVCCAALQGLTFLPLVLAACRGTISAPAIILVASLYWGTGLATGPAWNTWIGTLVPVPVRPRFFASRTRISQGCVFLGFLSAGIVLQLASQYRHINPQYVMYAYASLFGLACLCRLISVVMLAGHSEPIPIPAGMKPQSFRQLFSELVSGPSGTLLVFLVAVQAAVQTSGPYFTPFMLKNLHLSYAEYVVLIAVAFLARIFTLPVWGQLAHQVGARSLLWLGALGIAPISALWIPSQNFIWLIVIQMISGAMWAAYELAFLLMFFESIPEEKRTGMLTVYNLINTASWVLGAIIGGTILYAMGTSFNGYLTIFGLSGVGRFLALFLLARIPAIEVEADEIGLRTISVRPTGANLDAPVLPSLPDQIPDSLTAQAS